MVEEEKKGGRPINRPRIWNQEDREDSKLTKKTSWFCAGGYSTVIFCTYTPNSVLAKRWREVEERGAATRGWRYRVVDLYRRLPGNIVDLPVGGSRDQLYKSTVRKWVTSNYK